MKTPSAIMIALSAACGSSQSRTPPVATPIAQPAVIDDATFARLVTEPTDWSAYVSRTYGVVVVSAKEEVSHLCGQDALRVLKETAATMTGATCAMYESDGVMCTSSGDAPRSVLFDRNGSTWSGFGVWLVPMARSEALRKKFSTEANHGAHCS